MSEENKERARRFLEEAFGQGKVEVIDEVVGPDVVCHDPNAEGGERRGAETAKERIGWIRGVFPDLFFTVEDQLAEGDKVTTRYTFGGTHQGELMGAAPTGKRVEVSGINIDRFEGGKLVEEWASYDMLGVLRQVGAIPEPGQ